MSIVTLAPGDLEARVADAFQRLAYFKHHKARLLETTNLALPNELLEYGDKEQLSAYLKSVGEKIYTDIETQHDIFRVGNLGSIWYDKEYASTTGEKHLVRVGLIGNYNPEGIELKTEVFDARVKFYFIVDILDLM